MQRMRVLRALTLYHDMLWHISYLSVFIHLLRKDVSEFEGLDYVTVTVHGLLLYI